MDNSSACAYAQSSLLVDRPSQKPVWSAQLDSAIEKSGVTSDLCFTPLHHVVTGLEQADLRQQLRLNKEFINTPDCFGRSPLHWAVILGNSAAVEALLEHGAYPGSVDREQMTPLHNIFLAPPQSQTLCGRLLLNARAEVDALDAWKRTPFRIAVGYDSMSLDFLNMLINKGADINCRDIYSQSPLLKSIQGSKEATQLLLDYGADTEARDVYENIPVLEAIYRNKPEKLQMLLEHGAKINEDFELKPGRRARDGPIHLLDFIVWHGTVEIMQIFEKSVNNHYQLSHPTDTLEQFREFRLINGRKAGEEENEALIRILSKMNHSDDSCQQPDFLELEGDKDDINWNNEVFVDASECILEENCAV